MNLLSLVALAAFAGPLPDMPADIPRTDLPAAHLRAEKEARIELDVKLPKDWTLLIDGKLLYRVAETSGEVKLDPVKRKGLVAKPRFPIKVPFTPPVGHSELMLQVAFYYCPADGGPGCKAFSRYYLVPVDADAKAKARKVPVLVVPE